MKGPVTVFISALILVASSVGTVVLAADSAKGPRPIPADRQEAISREMLALMQAEGVLEQARQRATAERQKFQTMVEGLQKEFDAPGCNLTTEKTWSCPTTEGAKPDGR